MKIAKRISTSSKKSFGMYAYLEGAGRSLIHLEIGRPFADTPAVIKEATIAALQRGEVHYSDPQGLPILREALARKLAKKNGLDVSPEQILVTNGLTHAAFAAFMALLDDGDEVILLSPHYPQHLGKIELAGARPILVALDKDRGFSIDGKIIEAAITERTRMIVLVNPSNPTGRVYSLAELGELAQIAIRHDLIVVSDEVYEDITYDDARHVSIASLPGMSTRTVSMFAFTKSYAMDGWRVGYLVAPREVIPAMLKITMNDVTHVNTFAQYGALAAVVDESGTLAGLVQEDNEKRDLVVAAMNAIPGIRCAVPEGGIYAFANIESTGIPSQALAEQILEEVAVATEAGSFYGRAGEGYLRICFGSESKERLAEAMTRLRAFFVRLEESKQPQ
ncbi:pyridoxal phosphate-dependent aminotransferase [Cupriavidus sp. AcVe19-6a]|uniref:pyridoxal phosphate-dependent aminotransferase n=1 Tax=Cupriavidus sp. AcVe19-6a TaxID=2821358 RepID=UPI001AE4B55E|nr:aminotransferase class I/II-fold pyridoxal phosphate-dependent enzyme [Cupriavidus sp. AcVe19-6a]MBP0640077.1 aminotransferase class I/II-fold pyridoxal phosphate-dependent enzyme [Cupriavidus sp. AcVe19-6a]